MNNNIFIRDYINPFPVIHESNRQRNLFDGIYWHYVRSLLAEPKTVFDNKSDQQYNKDSQEGASDEEATT